MKKLYLGSLLSLILAFGFVSLADDAPISDIPPAPNYPAPNHWSQPEKQLGIYEPRDENRQITTETGVIEPVEPEQVLSIHAGVDSDTDYEAQVYFYSASDGFVREIRIYQGNTLIDRTEIGRDGPRGSIKFETGYGILVSSTGQFYPHPSQWSVIRVRYPNFLLIPSYDRFTLRYVYGRWRFYRNDDEVFAHIHVTAKKTLGLITGAEVRTD